MKNKVQNVINEIKKLRSPVEIRTITMSTIRIILQHACIAIAEGIIYSKERISSIDFYLTDLDLKSLRTPTDGTLVASLVELLVFAEKIGWNGISAPILRTYASKERPCCLFSREPKATLESILRGLVNFRNDVELGHGIPGDYNSLAEIDVLQYALEQLSDILPVIQTDDSLVIKLMDNSPYKLRLLKTDNGNLMCYRKIAKVRSGICQVKGQVQVALLEKQEIIYEAPDILGVFENVAFPQYKIISTYLEEKWNPFVILPNRITDDFVGRNTEIKEMVDWLNDAGSRACMLYGDGGIGKTTLTLEFLHRMIEGKITATWKPDVITFFTAKQTRWGLQGLEYIRSRPVGITELAVEIVRALNHEELDRTWYTLEPFQLIDKLTNFLRGWGIDQHNHLLILDNTETMISSEEELKIFSKIVRELSRKIGRILVTSRRREHIEANPIEILPLGTDESIGLLQRRAESLHRKQIQQAGLPRLKQLVEKMGNNPLILEVFVQALDEPGISLERALDRVIQMQRQDLGEFLYADAWKRLPDKMKHLLLLMTRIADMHDEFLLKLCCLQVGITVLDALEALGESKGIANITKIDDHTQIVFNPEFEKYCGSQTISISGNEYPTQQSILTIKKRYSEFLRASSTRIYDRVSKAYRHPLARAAYQAYQESRFDDCELFYEESVVADSSNGWLYDRYAYFLFSMGRHIDAHNKSKVATQLLPKDPETWFTRGIIETRMKDFDPNEAIKSLDMASSLGKEVYLCLTQKAYAYLKFSPPNLALSQAMLDESEKKTPDSAPRAWKNLEEIRNLRNKIEYEHPSKY